MNVKQWLAGAGAFLATGLAMADGSGAIDVSGVVSQLGLALVPIGLIGGAYLSVVYGKRIYKWLA